MRLTAKERILLYLLEIAKPIETVEAPPEMTQEAVSEGSGVDLRHLTQYVRPLIEEGLVRERRAHVKGIRQRRKVYDLTEAGKMAAVRLRERVKAETVRVRDDAGVRDVVVAKLLEAAPRKAALSEIVRQAAQGGIVELAALQEARAPAFVEILAEVPRVDLFVGRERELDLVASQDGRPRIFVVRGVAGIGKSALAAKVVERLRGHANLFWHRIRSWDTPQSVLGNLATFLAALGRPGLRAILTRGETDRVPQVLRDDLPGTRAFLVFDDAHEAHPDLAALFRYLKEAIGTAEDVRALFLTRRALNFYDRRDVSIHGLVKELDLGGLRSDEVAAFLGVAPDAQAILEQNLQLGGHPLFLKLVRAAPGHIVPSQILQDVRRFIEETVYVELSEAERGMMKVASLYRVPVPREAFFFDPRWSHDVLLSLSDRSLLTPLGGELFEVHDTIREFFAGVLTSAEHARLAPFALGQLRQRAEEAMRAGDLAACIDDLSNALQLPLPPQDRVSLWEAIGDADERLGDLPDALVAYKESMKATEDPDILARLHRKTAMALEVRGEMASASKEIEKAVRALGDRPSEERAWLDVVRCSMAERLEDWEAARAHGQAALAAFRSIGHQVGEARSLLALGRVETTMPTGNAAVAESHLSSALSMTAPTEDPDFAAAAHIALAHLYAYRLGRVDDALRHVEAVEALAGTFTDPHKRRGFLMLKGWVNLKLLADYDTATANFEEAAVLGRKIHDPHTITFARFGQAFVSYYRGRLEEACTAFRGLVTETLSQGFPQYAVESQWVVAECCLLRGDAAGFRDAVALFQDSRLAPGVRARELYACSAEGLEKLIAGDLSASERAFDEALRAAEGGFEADAALPHFLYGLALRAQGREGEAKEHLERAVSLYKKYALRADLASLADRERLLTDALRRITSRA